MKKPHGGSRPGAGRPKGSQNAQTIAKSLLREQLRAEVASEFQALIRAQIANAKGLKYLVARDPKSGKFERISEGQVDGERVIEVWEKDPSVQAFTDLMNRVIDKPIEPIEMEHSGGLEIRWVS